MRFNKLEGKRGLSKLFLVVAALIVAVVSGTSAEVAARDAAWAVAMLQKRASLEGTLKVQESPWYTTGPLKAKSFSDALFPEQAVDLDATKGQKKQWQKVHYANGTVNPLRAGDSTATYFYRTIVAEAPGNLQIGLGSDDGIEFWVNGAKLLSNDVPRGAGPDQDVVKASLKQGTNAVLLKIFNQYIVQAKID